MPEACDRRRSRLSALLIAAWAAIGATIGPTEPLYRARGRQVEERQHAFHRRLERFHTAIETALRERAPELLESLDPPPSSAFGYQVLPRIVDDATPPAPGTRGELVTYGWVWSETLIQREMINLDRLETELESVAALSAADRPDRYRKLISEYQQAKRRQRTIDSDVAYNWDWQRQIADGRALFDRLERTQRTVLERAHLETALAAGDEARLRDAARAAGLDATSSPEALRAALTEKERALAAEIASARRAVGERDFVTVSQSAPRQWVVSVPLLTDIADGAYVDELRRRVEDTWRVRTEGPDGTEYAVRLTVERLAPDHLYCGSSSSSGDAGPCTPPGPGAHLDVDAHVRRFPAGAVLTTGAPTLRLVDDRAIVLGPYDLSARVVAHELGHVLGFPDAYFRGYRDVGADGFQITELADLGDIMGAPGVGPVLPRHFEELLLAKAKSALDASLSLYREQRYLESIDAARNALRLQPSFAPAWNNLSAAYAGLGRWDEAIGAAREALRLQPDFELARNNLDWAMREKRAKGQATQ